MTFICLDQPRRQSIVVKQWIQYQLFVIMMIKFARNENIEISFIEIQSRLPFCITEYNSKKRGIQVALQILSKLVWRTFWGHFYVFSINQVIFLCNVSHYLMISILIFASYYMVPYCNAIRNWRITFFNTLYFSVFWIFVHSKWEFIHQRLKVN